MRPNSSHTKQSLTIQYAAGRKAYRAGARFNRNSSKGWQRGYVDARNEDLTRQQSQEDRA